MDRALRPTDAIASYRHRLSVPTSVLTLPSCSCRFVVQVPLFVIDGHAVGFEVACCRALAARETTATISSAAAPPYGRKLPGSLGARPPAMAGATCDHNAIDVVLSQIRLGLLDALS